MKNIKKLASLGTLAILGLLASNAGAVTHVLPGITCSPASGSPNGTAWYAGLRIFNTSTSNSLKVFCGIDPDGAASATNAEVRVIDNNPSSDASCQLRTRSPDMDSFGWSPWVSTSGNSNSVKTLSLGTVSIPAGGTAVFECDIPPLFGALDSALASYKIN